MSRRVLITGAAGFIGCALATHFRQQGANVFVDAARESGAIGTRLPLTEVSLLKAMGGAVPDVIFHAAGSGTVAKVAAQPAVELPANLAAMLSVLQFAQRHAPTAHVILLSSAALYGNAPATPQRESDQRAPVSLYGVAKAQAEELAAFYATQLGLRATAVRLFSVYGPGLRKQLLWDAMGKFAQGRSDFFGTGDERRDWLHIDDVCTFMSALMARGPGQSFDVFNCGGEPASTAEVLRLLASRTGALVPQFNGRTRVGDPGCLVADCGKAERELGWRASIGWRAGVVGYADWFSRDAVP